jgi:hypothetical protein
MSFAQQKIAKNDKKRALVDVQIALSLLYSNKCNKQLLVFCPSYFLKLTLKKE